MSKFATELLRTIRDVSNDSYWKALANSNDKPNKAMDSATTYGDAYTSLLKFYDATHDAYGHRAIREFKDGNYQTAFEYLDRIHRYHMYMFNEEQKDLLYEAIRYMTDLTIR